MNAGRRQLGGTVGAVVIAVALTWGDDLRGIQIYATRLSLADVRAEIVSPLSTPDDITDKSGAGHDPVWVGPERPALFSDPAVDPGRTDRGRAATP